VQARGRDGRADVDREGKESEGGRDTQRGLVKLKKSRERERKEGRGYQGREIESRRKRA